MPLGKFAATNEKLAQNFTNRQAQRFRADYLIRNGLSERRELSEEETLFFIEGIEKNRRSDFGVVKFANIDVDSLISINIKEWKRHWSDDIFPTKMTLCR